MNVQQRKQVLRDFLKADGWVEDRHGNFKIQNPNGKRKEYRYHFKSRVLRLEVKVENVGWMRLKSYNIIVVAKTQSDLITRSFLLQHGS